MRKSRHHRFSLHRCHSKISTMRIAPYSIATIGALAFSASSCHAFLLPSDKVQRIHHFSSSLNDDGDFLMEGINDGPSSSSSSSTSENLSHITSLLDFSVLKGTLQQPLGPIDTNDDLFLGIDENGDYPLETPSSRDENSRASESNTVNQMSSALLSGSNNARTFSFSESTPIGPNQDDEQQETLREFLLSILSNLNPTDLQNYAQGLMDIGFDPDCDSSRELQFDDLALMKPLHQRYFWNEWNELLS
jgi:hypothetical protein